MVKSEFEEFEDEVAKFLVKSNGLFKGMFTIFT